jgi:AraC family transcriptional regulator
VADLVCEPISLRYPPMDSAERTSAEAFKKHLPGKLIAASSGQSWKDLLVQIFSHKQVQETILVPAVAEPLIVWVLSGTATVEERELGGAWQANLVTSGDFFLTTSSTPYELRWKTKGPEPFEVMHLYLGLPIFNRAIKDVFNQAGTPKLREVSGEKDNVLSMLLEQLRRELTVCHRPSPLFVQSIAQSLAIHLVRTYTDPNAKGREQCGGLPAFKLRRVTELLETHLDEEFSLDRLAREVGVSEFHFCRLFKKTTGFTPSRYFMRMRMEKARRLLRETTKNVIEVGLDVGYSSPSHFAQIFKREVGVPPSEYRGQV